MTLDEFNSAPADVATSALLTCCDVPGWAATVRDGRPYPDIESALDAADKAARELAPADVDRALAAHPRIGERAEGRGADAELSREEQSGVSTDARTRNALLEGNRAYEERFGRVFLICATGLSGDDVLAALRERLGNDEQTEAAVVADELRKIAVLRLRKVLAG
ncbi:2-oxo-4-hydroxy-4-carboxy-5-ureidoimidazoline decarboxylase [Nocardioides antri]|uniref:2-oxo-4-hydroxy-4-carboxy-5-ureidoimidazoline decarboxylase n=1 Tax=Nocardioides antri TaxID=2607659 RepID=A0A5B1M0W5_9ACTN|nr:2-oxo-4-hydroxy-4-carboxy-5-ureidoimidazoline decarboxylase [Nocardioides antri]KAA1426572.1 2-oxo-4-hydroxy-4-carboxy-5-ureidoimidazoline decarboxylase [Nocardioides antri]